MEFLRFIAKDGVELTGQLYEGNKDMLVVHLHGWCGNFYENEFVQVVGRTLSENGVSFFALNSRAHDYKCDLRVKTKDGFTSKTGGGAVDDFYSSAIDLESTIKYFKKLGYKRIVLQGHSTAAQKVLYYAIEKKHKDIILLSAGDIHSEITKGNANSAKVFAEARKLVKAGKGDQYLKEPLWGLVFTAEALINGYGDNETCDYFPIRTGEHKKEVENYKGNVLNILGDQDSLMKLYCDTKEGAKYFKNSFSSANYKMVVLHDTHGFNKNPKRLASEITKWCTSLK